MIGKYVATKNGVFEIHGIESKISGGGNELRGHSIGSSTKYICTQHRWHYISYSNESMKPKHHKVDKINQCCFSTVTLGLNDIKFIFDNLAQADSFLYDIHYHEVEE